MAHLQVWHISVVGVAAFVALAAALVAQAGYCAVESAVSAGLENQM